MKRFDPEGLRQSQFTSLLSDSSTMPSLRQRVVLSVIISVQGYRTRAFCSLGNSEGVDSIRTTEAGAAQLAVARVLNGSQMAARNGFETG